MRLKKKKKKLQYLKVHQLCFASILFIDLKSSWLLFHEFIYQYIYVNVALLFLIYFIVSYIIFMMSFLQVQEEYVNPTLNKTTTKPPCSHHATGCVRCYEIITQYSLDYQLSCIFYSFISKKLDQYIGVLFYKVQQS